MLVRFLCLILLRMSCGRSLSVLRILPTGMCFFPALYSMLVNVLFASCMSVGGCSAAKIQIPKSFKHKLLLYNVK